MADALPGPKAIAESVALVVGGTSGVGLATARAILDAGARKVAICGRDAQRGERALASLGDPERAILVTGDACDPQEAARIVAETQARAGTIDVLMCATAPAILPDLFFRQDAADIAPALTQLALPAMYLAAAVLPIMRAQRSGVIINVASDAGKSATPGEAVIGAAMAAIVMFSRTLAMEAKRDGIRVNVLTPSLIAGTETTARILAGGFSQRLFEKAGAMASLGVAEPDDLAALAVFLASPSGHRLTGQAISVNGGISAA